MSEMVMRLRWAGRSALHARPRTAGARLRLLWHDFVTHGLFGPSGERCQDCGRGYPLWRADDDLYRSVVGHGGGLFCPGCFDRRAQEGGVKLTWIPTVGGD